MSTTLQPLTEPELQTASAAVEKLRAALQQVLFGQDELINHVITGLLARGHLLLEGLPGLGKTELVKGLAKTLQLVAKRIQFTPDLLPGDITGNPMLQDTADGRRFVFQPGPIFANLVLADEINRASPKTQSALLEAMQERRVTVMGESHALPAPFFVLATQNPIELEGTYPLPEAQLDRFLFKLDVRSNDADTLEKIVLHREIGVEPQVDVVMDAASLNSLLEASRRMFMPQPVANFIARLVKATHPGEPHAGGVKFGASPRAALALAAAAKARGLMEQRLNASYEDVRAVAPAVLRHRILLDYGAKLEGLTPDLIVAKLLENVPAQDKPLPNTLRAAKI
ncbi:MoxR-like ATPase [Roseimicrobium gellanilyticum]|uniref:MoxR-like ATPase n=1 Tax=Roseimicrobium gellanilyticum TaxID=748857 RepID=A0A366H6E3_9BACT|nr:AAA family ATPase [Roseimicrobium gellanilyticum]RBP37689.1 MoxR-like ATPase [Roseimicrobium gellanilyticum]